MLTPHLDFYAIFIFLGAVQGLYIAVFFLFRHEGNLLANRILSVILIVISLLILDIFLGYTGYMIYAIHLNNSTEPLNFLIGPLFYLYIFVVTENKKQLKKIQYLHFVPAAFFLFYMIPYFTIKAILKSLEDRKAIKIFIFATKFIILHTRHFSVLYDPIFPAES